jgi:hypothetical protein
MLSAETSKKLKEKGYPQSKYCGHFVVIKDYGGKEYVVDEGVQSEYAYDIICDSPTAQEIMEQLPDCIIENNEHCSLTVIKVKQDNYWVAYNPTEYKAGCSSLISFDGNSLVECLGNLFIWCKDNKYL